MGFNLCWLGVCAVSGCRQTMGKQRCPLSSGEEDIKHVLLMSGFRVPQRCKRELGSSGALRSVDR